ncbi:hypothetical protein SP60_03145 [Candidatus Thioglobus autotrophicus]|uniref:Uncharacterized protein n=1 Tax=Candidatus Thioglobus autotrophicus TaxID=1705394 RepID=A0A0M4NTD4_9GAMM|nr:hypothetical protein [Candidatus Thioglobus autotrophicus]ALE52307.1 hypothetical protein SP60_03145 [Candidatus Thioglobus autotrophicus]WPE16316.1 hypothetical protein R5P06_07125 [Candidatus Thioglobus autotrophicus]
MPIETMNVFPMIHSITIDKENDLVTELVQDINDAEGIRQNLLESVATVRMYERIKFYPLAPPTFIEDVMGSFAQMGLSRHITISDNTYHEINGYLGCTRVWELPLVLRDQVEKSLVGYEVEYDSETWEILDIVQLEA